MKEILTEAEKEAFEKYIDFKLPNGFRKEDFEFIKMQNPGVTEYPFFLRVRIRDYVKIFDVGHGDLKGMALGQAYTWKELGLYVNKGILSDKEKEYLSAVIKPFKDKVKGICKYVDPYSNTLEECEECIVISFENICNDIALPNFMQGTMYTGMKAGKEYTLKELGL